MSLGSRITTRAKAVIVANLASTPREPLLFLYPQWVRNSSTTTSEPAFARDGRPLITSTRSYTTPWTARSNTPTNARVENPLETEPVVTKGDLQFASSQNRGANSVADESGPVTSENTESHGKTTEKKSTPNCGPRLGIDIDDTLTGLTSGFQSKVKRTLQSREQAKINTIRNRAIREAYQTKRREQKQSWIPDWRVILLDLRRTTPRGGGWLEKAVSISVPENTIEKFYHGIDDNIWNMASKYDCSVELRTGESITILCNEFLLSGTAIAISKTVGEVMRIAPESKLEAGPQVLLSIGSKPTSVPVEFDTDGVRNSDAEYRLVRSGRRRAIPATRAEKIPRPSEWTSRTFAGYVNDLTSIQLPNHIHKLLYKREEDHIRATVGILRELFAAPECRSSMSRTSFNKALDYLVKTNHVADARATFVHMEMQKIEMDPETFNILLRGAAKNEDLHNFQFVLHLMLRRGISPNGHTWIAFLMANPDFRIKLYIVATMKEKGLLAHPSILKGVCEQLISQEISTSLDLSQTQEDFLNHMDSRYGKKWLTVDSGNRILHALGARHLISRSFQFLQIMDVRQVRPNQVSINTILNHCKQSKNIIGAIEIMKRLPSLFPFEPDQTTYHALFELAWRSRSYNLARIVWKYACLNACTTRRMRVQVYQSLVNTAETSNSNAPQYEIWRQQSGLFITSNIYNHPTRHNRSMLSNDKCSGPEYEDGCLIDAKETFQTAAKILERDYGVFHRWIPTRPFGDILMDAWERDQKWLKLHSDRPKLDWKLQDAISVPLRSIGLRVAKHIEWK